MSPRFLDHLHSTMYADFKLVLTSSLFIVILILYWYYKRFVAAYTQFPSCRFKFEIIYPLLTRKYPTNKPFSSFVFQTLCKKLQLFYSEGLCLLWFFQPYLMIFSEEAIKKFSQEQEATDKSYIYKVLDDIIPTGFFLSGGDTWKAHRKEYIPAFRLQMLKNYIPIFNKHAATMVETMTDAVKEPSINIDDYIIPCSMNIMFESIFDEENVADVHEWHSVSEKYTDLSAHMIFNPCLQCRFLWKFSDTGRMYLRTTKRFYDLGRKLVMRKKEAAMLKKDPQTVQTLKKDSDSKSFCQILFEIHSKDPTFTIDNVIDETISFFFGGYHTLAIALGWTILMLGMHPELQEKVYKEMKSLTNKDVTYEDLFQLTYLDCFIKETLRLYPPAPIYARRLNKDIKFGKYNVPKGTNIVFDAYTYHRNPNLYPDPEVFDPDRFKGGNSNNRPWTHITFSEGARNCMGKKFALLEMKVILVHFLTKFKVTALERRDDIELDWGLILKTTRPLRAKLSLRESI